LKQKGLLKTVDKLSILFECTEVCVGDLDSKENSRLNLS
jgi:hypothetical protein